jgi:hypothetical protein
MKIIKVDITENTEIRELLDSFTEEELKVSDFIEVATKYAAQHTSALRFLQTKTNVKDPEDVLFRMTHVAKLIVQEADKLKTGLMEEIL